ncbi:hypothetical protein BJV82DRAFT_573437 [Fennellomyces sp. T-0311]|nr:hypothetical protein BJV82DRAFT_573437 [Fennellomyces sp. T-0311]
MSMYSPTQQEFDEQFSQTGLASMGTPHTTVGAVPVRNPRGVFNPSASSSYQLHQRQGSFGAASIAISPPNNMAAAAAAAAAAGRPISFADPNAQNWFGTSLDSNGSSFGQSPIFGGRDLIVSPSTSTGHLDANGYPASGAGGEDDELQQRNLQEMFEKRRRRRESHNAVERRRRDNINERIHEIDGRLLELSTLLPDHLLENAPTTSNVMSVSSTQGGSGAANIKNINKGTILKLSVDHIKELKDTLAQYKDRVDELERLIDAAKRNDDKVAIKHEEGTPRPRHERIGSLQFQQQFGKLHIEDSKRSLLCCTLRENTYFVASQLDSFCPPLMMLRNICHTWRLASPRPPIRAFASKVHAKWEPWEDTLIRDFVVQNGRRFRDLAAHCLPHRTASAVEQRWTEALDPDKRRGGFSSQEIATLKRAFDALGPAWSRIRDQYLPQRTIRSIRYGYKRHCERSGCPAPGRWTPEEDEKLLKGYEEYGRRWTSIAEKYLPHRIPSSLRDRYDETLDPTVSNAKWSQAEYDLLLRRIIMYGQDWRKVAEGLPGRTHRACRRIWLQKLEPSLTGKNTWSDEEARLFWYLACLHNCQWTKVGQELGRSAFSCSIKFYQDIRSMQPVLGNDLVQRKEHENAREWKVRMAHAMRDWIDTESTIQSKPGGGLVISGGDWTPEEIKLLKEATQDTKSINWTEVATKVGKTAVRCRYKYDQLKHPDAVQRVPWTPQEDTKLRQLAELYHPDWERIASEIDGRTQAQCMYRWNQHLKHIEKPIEKGHFSEEEKALVREGVHMFGSNWIAIANTYLPHRTPGQCMRWWKQNEIKTGHWTEEEDDKLRFAVNQVGESSWKRVASLVPTRTASQCRVRWLRGISPNVKHGHWSAEEQIQLTELIQPYKDQSINVNWNEIAKKLGTGRSPWACRYKHEYMSRSGNRFGLRSRTLT